ncbi:MAG: glycosyltransferase family 4 protein, partial [Stackebrandtia sp.]
CYRGSTAQSAVMATTLAVNRGTWRRLDRYIALTEAVADHLRDFGVGDSRISVKPNAVTDPGEPSPVGSGFVFVGRLSAEKGIALLLDAWRRHGDGDLGTLTIAGDGPHRDLVEELAAHREDVVYVGQVTPAERDRLLRQAAALVSSSVCEDVLPTVVIEALAAGRAVLTTNLGGPPRMIGDAGIAVEPTVDGLADGLARMSVAAAGLAPMARQRYLRRFTPEVVLGQQLAIYRQLSPSR